MKIKDSAVRFLYWTQENEFATNEANFKLIWESYYSRIKVYASSFAADQSEDLASEILTKVFERIDSYKPTYSFTTWIFTVARNHCLDYLKKASTQREFNDDLIDFHKAVKYKSPEEVTIENEELESVRKFLASLKSDERELAYLRYFENMKLKTIAKITGQPLGSVKSKLFGIRTKLEDFWRREYE